MTVLLKIIKESGDSYRQAGEKLNIDPSYLYRVCKRKQPLTAHLAVAVHSTYGLSPTQKAELFREIRSVNPEYLDDEIMSAVGETIAHHV